MSYSKVITYYQASSEAFRRLDVGKELVIVHGDHHGHRVTTLEHKLRFNVQCLDERKVARV